MQVQVKAKANANAKDKALKALALCGQAVVMVFLFLILLDGYDKGWLFPGGAVAAIDVSPPPAKPLKPLSQIVAEAKSRKPDTLALSYDGKDGRAMVESGWGGQAAPELPNRLKTARKGSAETDWGVPGT